MKTPYIYKTASKRHHNYEPTQILISGGGKSCCMIHDSERKKAENIVFCSHYINVQKKHAI